MDGYGMGYGSGGGGYPAPTNGYGSYGGGSAYGGGYGGGGDSMSGLGRDLRQVDFGREQLAPIVKNYHRMPAEVDNMDPREVQAWREEHNIQLFGLDAPNPCLTFQSTGFPLGILKTFDRAGYVAPTPIQAQAWPIALTGRDMVGIAKTGSGKTLAFGIPGLLHIDAQAPLQRDDGPVMLVLAPTRELAVQIEEEMMKVMPNDIQSVCCYGGAPRGLQGRKLREGVHIVIATPGRLIDFVQSRETNLKRVSYLVMDEADRMLDMGFEPQIRTICSQIRPDRQTLMFSATWPREVQGLARDFARNYVQIQVGSLELTANADVHQHFELATGSYEKFDRVCALLDDLDRRRVYKVLIFTATKRMADEVAKFLSRKRYRAMAIHGDKAQRERDAVLKQFRHSKEAVMVATDVAARGLDIRDLPCVINFDFPGTMEDYVHRIGRTGRGGDKGDAYTFMSMDDAKHAREIARLLTTAKQEIPRVIDDLIRMAPSRGGGGKRGGKGRSGGFGGGNRGGGKIGRPAGGYADRGAAMAAMRPDSYRANPY
eukprot:TRINITY_DN1601_c5_g1_i2.p1 TRINITY_DN1601_c5_g1~~TRINITY_DN1601_c5_g1_i2.p1  ORF type:complete len:561 (+),score=131.28 TRINITY_DN1601_c5_g1_i2:59-1684(+)